MIDGEAEVIDEGRIRSWPTPSFVKLFACHRPRGQTKPYLCDVTVASAEGNVATRP